MLKKLFNQIYKFVLTGFLNTGIDIGLFALITWYLGIYHGLGAAIINIFTFLIANVNSFFWNKYWVFQQKQKNYILEYLKFLSTSLVALGIHTVVIYLGTTLIEPIWVNEQLWALGAKIIAVALSLIWNFIGYKFIVFKKY